MKNSIVFLFLTLLIVSCKTTTTKEEKYIYPEELTKVFEKHGGLENWKKAKTLSFNIGEEVHTSDLQSRKIVINSPAYSLGFNGKETWLTLEDGIEFKKNPDFYYNLYFYFYAMPFVLADDGITYQKVDDLIFEEKSFSGYKIAYNSDKGTSPDDNYIIYFNKETHQMEWLGYTVTFKSKKPSDKYNLIKYNKWENVDGLLLPKELVWYKKDEKGNPFEPAGSPTEFTFPLISNKQLDNSFFEKPIKK